MLVLKAQKGYKGGLYSVIYSKDPGPKGIKTNPITELHLASSYGHLTTYYFDHLIGANSKSKGNLNRFYLIDGGLVELSSVKNHLDSIGITHESKSGLEKIAHDLSLPKPSRKSIFEMSLD